MFPWPAVALVALISAILFHPLNSDSNLVSGNAPRILLLTAHPDDEAMFFAPTVLALTSSTFGDHPQPTSEVWGTQTTFSVTPTPVKPSVFSLCLSVGNADGLGATRPKELEQSLDILGIPEGSRWIMDHPQLQDNITVDWNPVTIAQVIKSYIVEHRITTILTFDHSGVSKHPNHKALPLGAKEALSSFTVDARPRLFTLVTVPTHGKYTGAWAATMAKFDLFASKAGARFETLIVKALVRFEIIPEVTESSVRYGGEKPVVLPVFVAGIQQYRTGFKAMLAHKSQLVWFRWLYLLFSRYMWVNEWVEVKV